MVAGLANFPENAATVKTLASTGNFRSSRAAAFGVITARNLNTKEGKEAGFASCGLCGGGRRFLRNETCEILCYDARNLVKSCWCS